MEKKQSTISKHYTENRQFREQTIQELFGNEGKVIYSIIKFDEKRRKNFLYEITENAVLIVKATDRDFIITKMLARPSRIKRVWTDAPKEILKIAIQNAKDPKRFA